VTISGTVPASGLNGLYSNPVNFNNPANSFTGNGAGLTNVNAAQLGGRTAAQFWQTGGNSGTTPAANFLGTTDNQPLELRVNNQRAFRLEPNPNSPNVVAGSPANTVTNGNYGAVIAGGGSAAYPNRVGAPFATVVGGAGNTASANYATAMGQFAQARGYAATALGYASQAGGFAALAAGTSARAEHDGSFVWADNTFADFVSTAPNQFSLRAAGGVRIASDPGIALNAADTPLITRGWDPFGAGAPPAKQGHGRWGLFMEPSALTLGLPGDDVPGRVFQVAKYDINGTPTRLLRVNQNGGVEVWGPIYSPPARTLVLSVAVGLLGGGGLRLEPAGTNSVNVVAGWVGNYVADGVAGATIGGGGGLGDSGFYSSNAIFASFATVAGGLDNSIGTGARYSAIGGGRNNKIADGSRYATIAGGTDNDIGTNSTYSAIGGGWGNYIADGSLYATIAGGLGNDIGAISWSSAIGGGDANNIADNSQYATIPGGRDNAVGLNASYAFAAGQRAKAKHTGAFVWGDSYPADIASANANSVTMRASGGYRLFSNGPATVGVSLAAGSGSWTSLSDRNAKDDFQPVNPLEVLEKVAALPVNTWRYKSQDASIRHIGPTAQDFKAAFGVGETDTGIATVDADGVALAAIQGLNQKLEQKLEQKEAEIAELKARLQRLEQLIVVQNGGVK
jgi:hypothetical protein